MFTDTFAVLDVETTGLGRYDRVAEVAVVTVDHTGKQLDRWETLVNPERDLGPQHVHGIRAEEIRKAPTFAEIADELEFRLSGNVLVAHNLAFDSRFLVQEFARLNRALPGRFLDLGRCTMTAARSYLPGARRGLRDCCDAFSIDLLDAHCAGADAEATATLLGCYLDIDARPWHSALEGAVDWFGTPPPIARVSYRKPANWQPPHFLEKLAASLPASAGPAEHDQYLALLDRALLDRYLSASEKDELLALAADLGIDRQTALRLHREYFEAVVDAAWEDGIVTESERADLVLLAGLLGMDDAVLAAAFEPRLPRESPARTTPTLAPAVRHGDLVCLTGDMQMAREDIVARLGRLGIGVHPGVTKKVKLLIAADPDSLSGKARKARDYGIPVVSEDYLFTHLLKGEK
ncbi:exonuclease domain-containing protein [Sinomonas flava]|uniref:exonuclease domain-containing protein n=1 Tax=Sinomonas flava TaxID=496857 RepID=UPI0039A6D796